MHGFSTGRAPCMGRVTRVPHGCAGVGAPPRDGVRPSIATAAAGGVASYDTGGGPRPTTSETHPNDKARPVRVRNHCRRAEPAVRGGRRRDKSSTLAAEYREAAKDADAEREAYECIEANVDDALDDEP